MKRHTRSLIEIIDSLTTIPCFGAEVGSWDGENAEQLLRRFPTLYLYLIDRYEPLRETEKEQDPRMGAKSKDDMLGAMESAWHRTAFANQRRVVMRGDSARSAQFVPYKTLDFVFIDAHHALESVARDIAAWHDRLTPGGVLCGHDYDGRGDRIGRFGVKEAVDSFASLHNYTVNVSPGHVWSIVTDVWASFTQAVVPEITHLRERTNADSQ